MKIYTGYFGRMRYYVDFQCIAISRSVPVGLIRKLPIIRALAPTLDILVMKDHPDEYTKAYNQRINLYTAEKVFAEIKHLSNGKDVVLLCYEKPGAFCHRHLVAKWLNKKLGIEVEEIKK